MVSEASNENWIIRKLQDYGWIYNSSEELEERNNYVFLLKENLLESVRKINSVPETLISDAISKLDELTPSKDGNSKFLDFLKHGINVVDENRQIHTIRLLDETKIHNNSFIVTNQFNIKGKSNKRPDIVMFVNGMPLVIMENKNPYNMGTLELAYNQIKGYEESVREMFTYLQIAVINNGVKGELFPLFFNQKGDDTLAKWKTSYPLEPTPENEVEVLLYGVFHPDNFVKILTNYIHIRKKGDRNEKIMARYMQFRATEKILRRIDDNLNRTQKESVKTGLIWHWQGSGKTLIMANTAYQIRKKLPDATLLIVVDRKDLDNQALTHFSDIQGLEVTQSIGSTTELAELISYNNGNGKPGIFIVTIQKFSPENFRSVAKNPSLERGNVICLVDESHRTQYGLMAGTFRNAFPNAFVFGFTGTPIRKSTGGKIRNTFEEFCPPGELYLDRYSMKDAQDDGFTVPIAYEYNAAIPAVKDQIIKEALNHDEEVEYLTETEKELLNRKIRVIKELYKTEANVETIARDVASHFQNEVENSNNGLKAMLVAVDREACVMYKRKLDTLLSPEASEVVMTFGYNETSDLIKEYKDELESRTGKDVKKACKEFAANFDLSYNPKILIVTDMLLTGFDSSRLWVMYLAKPLFEERLLQAIGRTDRPFTTKDYGYVIDYVYLLETLNKTLKKYEGMSSEAGIRGIVISREEIEKDFVQLLDETYAIFGDFDFSNDSHENLDRLIKILSDSEISDRFEKNFRKLTAILNLPRAKTYLMAHMNRYKVLAKAYGVYINNLKLGGVNEQKVQEAYERVKKIVSENFFLEVENKGNFTIDRTYLERLGKTRDYAAALRVLNTWHMDVSNRRFRYPSLLERIVNAYQRLMKAKAVNEEILNEIKSIKERMDSIDSAESVEGETKTAFKEAIKAAISDMGDNVFNLFCENLADRKGIKLLLKGERNVRKVDRKDIMKSIRYSAIKVLNPASVPEEDTIVELIYKGLRETFGF
ncbi:type I site-specific deoxyribonuclease, HsdR family [Thermoplasmatales archaeon]|nr:type I site-specific deoxyribonuclease, HsdR family [Thermoplasmatales archaeon]